MKNVIATITNEVNEILSKCESDVKEEDKQLEDLNELVSKYEHEMDEAVKIGDTEAYKAAQAKLAETNFQKKYHQSRLENFTKGHLIDEAEYDKMIADLMLYLRKKSDDLTLEAVNLLQSERNKADALKTEIHAANELMKTLQHKVYREDVYKKDAQGNNKIGKADGRPIVDPNKVKSFNDFDVVNWLYYITYETGRESGSYIDKMRKKVEGK